MVYEPILIPTNDRATLELYLSPDDGIPLLYQHGTPATGLPYEENLSALAERGLRYVAWSRPGYGGSTRRPGRDVASVAADASVALDYIGAQRAYALGWSGGGPHALALAALLPTRVIGVATIGSVAPYRAPDLGWRPGPDDRLVSAALNGPDALREEIEQRWPVMRGLTGQEFKELVAGEFAGADLQALSPGFSDWIAALFRTALSDSYGGWFDDERAFVGDWGFDATSITALVHVWHGADDRGVHPAHGEWLASHIPTARAHFRSGDGHLSLHTGSAFADVLDALIA